MARFSPVFSAGSGGHRRKGSDRRGDVSTGSERVARRPPAAAGRRFRQVRGEIAPVALKP
jgi:hypothetical protein